MPSSSIRLTCVVGMASLVMALSVNSVNAQLVRGPIVEADSPRISFAVVSDRTGRYRSGRFEEALNVLRDMQPDFVVSVGDLIEGYSLDREVLATQWDEVERMVDESGLRFYAVPGNHDIDSDLMRSVWEERYGRSYFHARHGPVLLLGLDSSDRELEAQEEYFRRVVEENRDATWIFVFLHHPEWEVEGRSRTGILARVVEAIGEQPFTAIAGHIHRYRSDTLDGRRYLVLGTTGGGSQLRGPEFGEVDHISWISVSDGAPAITNIQLDGLLPVDFMTASRWAQVDTLLKRVVHVPPLDVDWEGDSFVATGTIELVNDLAHPIRVEAEVTSDGPPPTPRTLALTIPSNERRSESLTLSGSGPLTSDPLVVSVSYEVTVLDEAGRWPPVAGVSSGLVGSVPTMRSCPTDPIIDAVLAEWDSSLAVHGDLYPESKNEWTGRSDGNIKAYVCWAEGALFAAVVVSDQDLVVDEHLDPFWERDGIRLQIDPDPASTSLSSGPAATVTGGFPFAELLASPAGSSPDGALELRGAEGVVAEWDGSARINESGGLDAEFSVRFPGDLDMVRLNFMFVDNDADDGFPSQLYLFPRWTPSTGFPSEQEYSGAGTFILPDGQW